MTTTSLKDAPASNGSAAHGVRLPAQVTDPAGRDLAKPTADLLQKVAVLETEADAEKGVTIGGTPPSLQAITSGVLSSTKVASGVAATGGIGGAVTSFLAATRADDPAVQITLIAAAGVILAAALIAMAKIVASDVSGRAAASVAQYQARASIVSSLYRLIDRPADVVVETSESTAIAGAKTAGAKTDKCECSDVTASLLNSMSAYPTAVRVKGDHSFVEANGVRHGAEGLQIRLLDGDWVNVERVEQFRPA